MNVESFLTIPHLKESPAAVIQMLEGADANALYRATLAIQNELNIGAAFRYLDGRPEWQRARSVLDLGCGPGDLIAHLGRRFPGKAYTGVDMNPDFIAIAAEQTRGLQACRFIGGDLYDFSQGRHDFIILRAVLQHLKDPDRLMKHLPDLLSGNGVVLFLDTTRENFVEANPSLAVWNDFYDRVEAVQKEHTGSRDCMAELEARLPGTGFRILESLGQSIPVAGAEDRQRVIQYLILGCSITARMMSLPVDLKALVTDLLSWHDARNSNLVLKSRLMLMGSA
jgi:SAM-dependent methyltransferase